MTKLDKRSLAYRWQFESFPHVPGNGLAVGEAGKFKTVETTLDKIEQHMREAYYNSDAGKARLRREQEVSKRIA